MNTKALSKHCNVKVDVINQWVRRGLISPTVKSTGQGSQSVFWSNSDCIKVMRIAKLNKDGMRLSAAVKIVESIENYKPDMIFDMRPIGKKNNSNG